MSVCDETQNLNDTDSETFFRYQIFSRLIPRLCSVPKKFRDRFRDFFWYQIFSRPVPRLFSVPNFFDSGSDTIKKNEEFPGTGIPGTGTSHSDLHYVMRNHHPCIRNLVHSSVEPDFRQSPPVEPDFRKTGHDPQKRLNFVAKKVKNDCEKKSLSPNPSGHGFLQQKKP